MKVKKYMLLLVPILLMSFVVSNKLLNKKVDKVLRKAYKETEIVKEAIAIETKNKAEKWYVLKDKSTQKKIGFMETSIANSRTNYYDYMVLFNLDKTIKQVNVLIYREEIGGEISSKRWLKQFKGLSNKSKIRLDKEIDGISGATISCNSLTNAINSSVIKITKIQ